MGGDRDRGKAVIAPGMQMRRGLRDHGYAEMAVSSDHTLQLDLLPAHHKDPFDRLLVAQAMAEGIMLLTADPLVATYPGPIRLV